MIPGNGAEFERIIHLYFRFLSDSGMAACGTRQVGQPPGRESGYVHRYEDSDFRVEIGWNGFELSLGVLLEYINKLSSRERFVYFEPLVEFLTDGREKAIVPYVAENMGLRSLKRVMAERKVVFAEGLGPVAERLAQKLKRHLDEVRSVSIEQIKAYHSWIASIR